MRYRLLLLASSLALSACGAPGGGAEPDAAPSPAEPDTMREPDPWPDASGAVADPELAAITRELWQHRMRSAPTWATRMGDPRYHGRLTDLSLEGFLERAQVEQALLERLSALDPDELTAPDRRTRAVLARELELDLAERDLGIEPETWTLDPIWGPQVELLSIAAMQPVGTAREREQLLQRWRAMPNYLDQHVANLRRGLRAGRFGPHAAAETVLEQLEGVLATPVADSPLHAPIERLPRDVDPRERGRFERELLAVIRDEIRPAFRRYRDFVAGELLPLAREGERSGVLHLAGGDAYYELQVRRHTTLDLTAGEIHDLGLERVAAVRAEMEELGRRALGAEDFAALRERLREDPAFSFETRAEILAAARAALAKAEEALPRALGRLPRTPVEVVEIPAHEAPDTTTAYYMPPAADGSRPGRYYVNTHEPRTRPRYEAEVLAYHESVPGHHTQIALAQELTGLPLVRRHSGVTAYVEGWALYTERLADELGLYTGDLDRLGMLSFDAWRAARLVVDTGVHRLGWSRERAIEYMLENTLASRLNVENEVDRYIAWPGQALAYMIGRLEIQALRAEAERRLAGRFDLRAFHDELLRHGPLPLEILREEVEAWIAAREEGP